VTEPCDACDFIGPVVSVQQPVLDFHRNMHDSIRTVIRAFQPLSKILREAQAAQDAYTLAGPSKGDSK
jgi:hypothetical protein